jgi:hypothetical protein
MGWRSKVEEREREHGKYIPEDSELHSRRRENLKTHYQLVFVSEIYH